jgi:hypothetical protein
MEYTRIETLLVALLNRRFSVETKGPEADFTVITSLCGIIVSSLSVSVGHFVSIYVMSYPVSREMREKERERSICACPLCLHVKGVANNQFFELPTTGPSQK